VACAKDRYRAAHRGVQAQGGERQAADEARRLRRDAEAARDEAEGGEAGERRQGDDHRVQRPGRVRRVGEPLQLRAAGQHGAEASGIVAPVCAINSPRVRQQRCMSAPLVESASGSEEGQRFLSVADDHANARCTAAGDRTTGSTG
jgi:hypothetical protein